ncbi:hypothetical protein EYB53_010940 [Candidatus Chloroploca sp. M-50]|uniref:Uncharacterized protein n=1 Tax=Candidatus Chloroploca mongolica TaxID=2528176 RepID=A0ABS4D9V0_9CHLR|nr:hypothetical protein [Candidatus Chloroploca mongolica]MBP1466221.1 hypothetical protein [Candidatus Chloroploca mongolica]
MTTPTTMFDGLLDDATPTTLTARTQADALLEPDAAAGTPVSAANPDDEAGLTTEPAPVATDLDPHEKLVIVDGQRFLVAAEIDHETIRQHLIRQGFATLAGATIRTGTTQHDGRTLATVDFIKQAGTKG